MQGPSGVNDIALAFTADAYSRTGRSQAYSLAATGEPVMTRHGLTLLPDRVVGANSSLDRTLATFDTAPSMQTLDQVLAAIATDYGRSTAHGVALDFEYPRFQK